MCRAELTLILMVDKQSEGHIRKRDRFTISRSPDLRVLPLASVCVLRCLSCSDRFPTLTMGYSHPKQIKEAADIIQKLHLIAQELPFDR